MRKKKILIPIDGETAIKRRSLQYFHGGIRMLEQEWFSSVIKS